MLNKKDKALLKDLSVGDCKPQIHTLSWLILMEKMGKIIINREINDFWKVKVLSVN